MFVLCPTGKTHLELSHDMETDAIDELAAAPSGLDLQKMNFAKTMGIAELILRPIEGLHPSCV
jgi:hypothetical protein